MENHVQATAFFLSEKGCFNPVFTKRISAYSELNDLTYTPWRV